MNLQTHLFRVACNSCRVLISRSGHLSHVVTLCACFVFFQAPSHFERAMLADLTFPDTCPDDVQSLLQLAFAVGAERARLRMRFVTAQLDMSLVVSYLSIVRPVANPPSCKSALRMCLPRGTLYFSCAFESLVCHVRTGQSPIIPVMCCRTGPPTCARRVPAQ